MAWYENIPEDKFARCADTRIMKFGNKCGSRADKSSCMAGEGQRCHWSWPHEDPDKNNSVEKACRTVPASFINDENNDIEFKFGRRVSRRPTNGLCAYGCGDAECKWSYHKDDPEKWKSASAMFRCAF